MLNFFYKMTNYIKLCGNGCKIGVYKLSYFVLQHYLNRNLRLKMFYKDLLYVEILKKKLDFKNQ